MRPSSTRSAAFLALVMLVAAPAGARDPVIKLPDPVDGEEAAPAKPPAAEARAIQVNRCPNAQGGITLQDTPCAPLKPLPAASAAAVEVVELSSLQPRPPVPPRQQVLVEDASPSFARGMLNGAWKLGLLLLGGYLLMRGAAEAHHVWRRKRDTGRRSR